jgi:hypothetical protein
MSGALDRCETMSLRMLRGTIHALLHGEDIVLIAYTREVLQRKINVLREYL